MAKNFLPIGSIPPFLTTLARFGELHGPVLSDDWVPVFGRIASPADLRLDWDGAPPLDVYPGRLPDLHAGEPLFVSLRLGPAHPGQWSVDRSKQHLRHIQGPQ